MFSFEHMDRDTHNSDSPLSQYWDFSWDEMIKYDVKANIDYVKLMTGYEKVVYFGHSQGTIIYFMGYTVFPEYFEQSVEKFVGLGPMFSLNSSVNYFFIKIDFSLAQSFQVHQDTRFIIHDRSRKSYGFRQKCSKHGSLPLCNYII